jgi:hypothetical protein
MSPDSFATLSPVAFLRRRAAAQLAAAKLFYEAIGIELAKATAAAARDLPNLYIAKTHTEKYLAEVVRFAGNHLRCAKNALEAIEQARTESELAFLGEMSRNREQRQRPSDEP